jgi:hypothetical protein
MGFITREQRVSKFLNFKDGLIVHSEGGDLKTYDAFSGRVIDLEIEDAEYQGEAYRKIILFIEDPETDKVFELGFSLESGYGNAFCCIAPNIDWSKPLEISGKIEDKGNGKKYSGMFIRQEGKAIKWFYTNAHDESAPPNKKRPAPEKVRVGNNDIFDFSKRNNFYEKMLIYVRKEKIVKITGGVAAYKPRNADLSSADGVTEVIDDLPF